MKEKIESLSLLDYLALDAVGFIFVLKGISCVLSFVFLRRRK